MSNLLYIFFDLGRWSLCTSLMSSARIFYNTWMKNFIISQKYIISFEKSFINIQFTMNVDILLLASYISTSAPSTVFTHHSTSAETLQKIYEYYNDRYFSLDNYFCRLTPSSPWTLVSKVNCYTTFCAFVSTADGI